MKTRLFISVAIFAATLAPAMQAAVVDIEAITAKPTADNPQYDNKKAWPMLVGDEYFTKQKWDKARLLIWGHPGTARKRGAPKIDPKDAANWIDAATGKPAGAIPDMDTDIIIPAADKPYMVAMGMKSFACRHLTVGRNAQFSVEGGGNFTIFGNVWIRTKGMLTSWRNTTFAGNRDTFLRQEWPEDGRLKKIHDERLVSRYDPKAETPWLKDDRKARAVATYMVHDKTPGKSTEIIGYVRSLDEVGIKSGTLIVGRDSRFLSMGPATVAVSKGAKIILMDGAQCSHGMNQFVCRDWSVAGGAEVTGGAPDRPLRRDAYFGVGYHNWMNLPIPQKEGAKKKLATTAGGTKLYYGYGQYSAIVNGDLTGYPAKGTDARLVVCWQRISAGGAGCWGRTDDAFKEVFPNILPKIGIWISGKSKLTNVRFDDLHRGGIVTQSMETFKSWKNISFGKACLSTDPSELVRGYAAEVKKGSPTSILEPKNTYTTK